MAIPRNITLAPGQIVMVEFGPDPRLVARPGIMTGPLAVLPEMYKERHGIVVSTKAPSRLRAFHFRIPAGKYPGTSTVEDSWTKSDLLTTVSNGRVDRVLVAGRRTTVILDAADLHAVRGTILHALQLGRLTPYL